MPTDVPPSRSRRALPSLRPTILYQPMPRGRAAHGGAPPCVPDDGAGDGRGECPFEESASPFWYFLRGLLDLSARR